MTLGFFAENIREHITDHCVLSELGTGNESPCIDKSNRTYHAAIEKWRGHALAAKKLADQQGYYELYQNSAATNSFSLFNYRKFHIIHDHPAYADNDTTYALLSQDKKAWMEFGNKVLVYEGVVDFYNQRLREMKDHAAALIITLKKAYDIDED
jgi:hypothetical protein